MQDILNAETSKEAANRIYWDCFPQWYNNGHFMKMNVAKDYAKKICDQILKETIEQYTDDENHDRVIFWHEVKKEIDNISEQYSYINQKQQ